jgi:hypothetical protein
MSCWDCVRQLPLQRFAYDCILRLRCIIMIANNAAQRKRIRQHTHTHARTHANTHSRWNGATSNIFCTNSSILVWAACSELSRRNSIASRRRQQSRSTITQKDCLSENLSQARLRWKRPIPGSNQHVGLPPAFATGTLNHPRLPPPTDKATRVPIANHPIRACRRLPAPPGADARKQSACAHTHSIPNVPYGARDPSTANLSERRACVDHIINRKLCRHKPDSAPQFGRCLPGIAGWQPARHHRLATRHCGCATHLVEHCRFSG